MGIASSQNMDNALVNQWLQKQHGVGADYRPDIPAMNSWLSPYLANGTLDMNRVPEIAAAIRANDPSGTANISGGWVPGGYFAGAPITSVGGGNVNFDSTANTGDMFGNLLLGAAMSGVAGLGLGAFGPGAGYAAGAGGEGALSAAEFAANAGVGANPTIPAWAQPMAGGVADTGFGANTIPGVMGNGATVTDAGVSGMNLADPWSAGVADPSLSVGNLNVPNYAGNVLDQVAPAAGSVGNAGWDAMLGSGIASAAGGVAGGAASAGAVASLAKSLGISEAAALKVLGAGGGALLGSLNGSKPAGTTTTTTDIPEWLKPYATNLLDKGQTLTNAAPQDFSQSDSLLKNVMAGTANPYSQQDNPYFEKTLNLALNDTQGRVNNQFRNSAFGGSANQELLARNLGDQANNLRFGQYKNAQDLYTTDLNRATNVATGMPQYSAQKTQSNFQPLLNQKSLLGFGGSQTSSPYFSNPTSGALYGGLLGSQLFGGK